MIIQISSNYNMLMICFQFFIDIFNLFCLDSSPVSPQIAAFAGEVVWKDDQFIALA